MRSPRRATATVTASRDASAPGRLIVIEGAHGAGKSTQARLLAAHLEVHGRPCLVSEDARGTHACDAVRRLASAHAAFFRENPLAAALAWAMARRSRIAEVIRPALEGGWDVVSVRWSASTLVHQSLRGAPTDPLDAIARHSAAGLTPAVAIVLDAPAAVHYARCTSRPGRSAWDPASLAEAAAVSERYRAVATREGMVVVDGDASIREVHRRVVRCVEPLLGLVRQPA